MKTAQIFADSSRGIYIPQHFAESARHDKFKYIEDSEWAILESGPDNESYWDAWESVLSNAETLCGGVLHHDGDLWIVWQDNAIDAINGLCECQLEYETRNGDAGDNYAHMPAESWTETDTRDFVKSLKEDKRDHAVKDHFAADSYKPQWQLLGIDPRWKAIDPDVLADMALESFDMSEGSIWGCFEEGITLASYAVQEIEIDLDSLGIDNMTLDLVRESCDAYISGDGLAYVTTDACWFALLDVQSFNAHIENHFTE